MQFAVSVEFSVRTSESNGKRVGFLSLAFPAVMRSRTIPLDALNTTLFLLVLRLCAFARRQRSLGLWKFLPP
jgi:hypothetical protein